MTIPPRIAEGIRSAKIAIVFAALALFFLFGVIATRWVN